MSSVPQSSPGVDYVAHPVADIFPLLHGDEFDALVEDIRQHGLREAIVVAGGVILDGRNRWRACEVAGVEPTTIELPEGCDVVAFIFSKNLHRRHLTVGQRAMVAAKLANMTKEQNLLRGPEVSKETSGEISAADAAKLLHVGRPQVFQAKTVLEHGTPDEIAAIERGDAKVTTLGNQVRKRAQEAGALPPPKPRTKDTDQSAEVIDLASHRKRGRPKHKGVKLPAGASPESIAREAIALHGQISGGWQAVGKQLGVHHNALRQMADIVQIAERTDLPEREAELAQAALQQMTENATRIEEIFKPLEVIARRLWGEQRKGDKAQASRREREAARLDRFDHALGITLQACENAPRIDIPHLSLERAREVLREIEQAISSMRTLASRIRGIHA